MHSITLSSETDFDGWRKAARALVLNDVRPWDVKWKVQPEPFEPMAPPLKTPEGTFNVPAKFVELAKSAILNRDHERFAILYRLLGRLKGNHDLLDIATDPDVSLLAAMTQAVQRDAQRMQDSVRFREIGREQKAHYVAWFEPEHHVVATTAPFFASRFADMPWSILTPDVCAHWDGHAVTFTPGLTEAPSADRLEETWRRYAADIFNPARLKMKTMQTETPRKSWNLPEASTIKPPTADAMTEPQSQPEPSMKRTPAASTESIAALREEAATCRACPLWKDATQTVFGEGPQHAKVMLVGEQPGRGTRGAEARSRAGGSRHRPQEDLHHRRGQTFQILSQRKNPPAPEAEYVGDQGMPAMV